MTMKSIRRFSERNVIGRMSMVRMVVDGKEVLASPGQTILDVCRENNVHIPTLCHDEQLKPLGSCQICVVELEEHGLVASCATSVADGMVIYTENAKVISARRQTLESLLLDHYGDCTAPCHNACPAGIDIQGYISLIARGAYKEAVELIKERLPLPAAIGRICPRPCEEACRRNLVDEPISICSLKRFAADYVQSSKEKFIPKRKPGTGFRVAIVGAGPAGLSAAYYLIQEGHEVTIFEALPKLGGMLQYGIPDYRLPKNVLEQEIAEIVQLGVAINTNQVLGKDFSINSLLQDGFNAIFLTIGAHHSQSIGVDGEDLKGVLPGTDFLRSVAMEAPPKLSGRVAVIGGGNTAIDAARSALRLGAKEVTIVYRRSRLEMPASKWEIEEAEEEGIKLYLLASPVKITGEDGKVSHLECIKMSLGEIDASGRRRPAPILGSEFGLDVDYVIAAVGQHPDLSFMAGEDRLKAVRGTIKTGPDTLMTDISGVFAGGDAVTGPATAVEAIASGKKVAMSIDQYLKGGDMTAVEKPFNITKGELSDLVGREEFVQVEHQPKRKMPKLQPLERRATFQEIELGYLENIARKEAERCLECGCKAAHDCTLRELSTKHRLASVTARKNRYYPMDKSHPFIERDPNKCINCERCARICLDVLSIGALSVGYRVGTTEGYGGALINTTCVSCGTCVASCPVGALVAKKEMPPVHEVKTICPYCGVGCGIYLGIRGGLVVSVKGDPDNPVNKGNLCVKGRFGYEYVNHPERLTSPLIKRDGKFVEATWEEAFDLIAAKLGGYKGGQFATISSAKCTNEENYIIQKFTRAVMRTNNIDHCARLCHAPSVSGLTQSLGSGAMTNSINEIEDAACIFAIGTNTTASHPIIGLQVKKAVQNGTKLIVANPRKIDLCRFADLWLQHRSGTDVALLSGIMRVIVEEGLLNQAFIRDRCENFDTFKESLASFSLDFTEQITGVPREKIVEAARLYATNKPATILYAMGITQHSHGTDNVLATSNLALLTGNIGKPSTGVNPLRGQNNVQGACDMGALPNVYSGYQREDNPKIKQEFEAAWGCSLSDSPGLTLTDILEAAYQGQIKALYIVGENPLLSEPDAQHASGALERLEFLVVQDIFLTETARLAHVVLPAATFAEKDGTFTNTERRVQRVRQAISPIGDSKPDWWITCEIARRLGGRGFDFTHPVEIMEEIATLTPSYRGISYGRLERGGLQWPCPSPNHPGTPILHTEHFPTSSGKGQFVPLEYKPPAEIPNEEYPLILTTERSLYHYHTGTMTRRVEGLNVLRDRELVEMNPEDAAALGIADGEIVRVVSRRGQVTTMVKVTKKSPPGVVSMTFHFAESPTNILTNPALDPIAKIPELKVCAVRIEKVKVLMNKEW